MSNPSGPPRTARTDTMVDQVCLENPPLPPMPAHPSVPPIYTAAVYGCDSTQLADQILAGQQPGFAYQRDAHPNAARLAEKCRKLHQASAAAVTSSGMAALSAIVLGTLQAGDHILVSHQLYGRSSVLLEQQLPRLGIEVSAFDPFRLEQLPSLYREGKTRMAFAETIANPLLRLVDIPALVAIGRERNFQIAIDNTFATPYLCRPLELGADWVWESYSKMLNGHSDVMMGLVASNHERWPDVAKAISTWGLSSAPLECYLAERGLTTFGLRIRQSLTNARKAAMFLEQHPNVVQVHYPGLPNHPDYGLLPRLLNQMPDGDENAESRVEVSGCGLGGNVVTFQLAGEVDFQDRHSQAVSYFLQHSQIPYYPSLGDCVTSLSHPCSSSHRHLSPEQRQHLGINSCMVRLCLGIEPWSLLKEKLLDGLGFGEDSKIHPGGTGPQ